MAGIWGRFVSMFQKDSTPDGLGEYDAPEVQAENITAEREWPVERLESPVKSVSQEVPHWLVDEEALRDEGVLFGLSESDPTVKTDIIQKYFSQLAAPFEREIEEVNERIQELNLFIEQRQTRINALQDRLQKLETAPVQPRPHQVLRTGVGLLLSVLMCAGNYSLIEQTLQQGFQQSEWVALGVFMAGMFNLFGSVSVFHDHERTKPGFWRLLEETGMPIAASLFVFAQAWEYQSWWRAAALFFFVLFLFLFTGKLFLGMVTVFREDLYKWIHNRKDVRKEAEDKTAFEEEMLLLNEEIDEIRTQKWQRVKEQGASEEQKSKILAKRDMLIKLFESEFDLARQVKNAGRIKGVSEL